LPGKTAAEAAEYFHNHFRESLSVITDTYLNGIRREDEHLLLFEPPPRLQRKAGKPVFLNILQTFKTVPMEGSGFRAHTTSYHYSIAEKESEAGEYGIFAYHWHPRLTPKLKWPHLHVLPSTSDSFINHRVHFPTARICIEDFVRLLIRDFGVRPRLPHEEWKKLLAENKSSFAKHATWLFSH
jgi:hypothetical protein